MDKGNREKYLDRITGGVWIKLAMPRRVQDKHGENAHPPCSATPNHAGSFVFLSVYTTRLTWAAFESVQ
jgi:hypothetical protein